MKALDCINLFSIPHHILKKIAQYAAEFVLVPLDAENVITYCRDPYLDSWEKIVLIPSNFMDPLS